MATEDGPSSSATSLRQRAVVLLLNWPRREAEELCQRVEEGPQVDVPFPMDEERYTLLICHQTRRPLQELWVRLKRWS